MTDSAAADDATTILDLLVPSTPTVELDNIDLQLIRHLHEDSSISLRSLGALVGMSAPSVGERVARLERTGVIRRRSIEMDWSAMGRPMLVVIPIKITSDAKMLTVIEALQSISSLTEILILSGTYDMMARFRLKDHAELQTLLLEKLGAVPGLQRVEAMISLGRVDDTSPLSHILGIDD
ncbi:AsnC family transcriptional regulator [Rhodoglobus vestalii]|uniref:AsnC family transcriptional regulator n=1 Tax=Rhodoglobus vestalii TaxID=193384 RepID=A0A8H2K7G3_9MICO|nr:Lrp/AsnC family transcriptional regulator [Rhodoglobus vestalii]TQO20238.1 AsnC family transcriptional regulator [Rhodoglobus vestalii]